METLIVLVAATLTLILNLTLALMMARSPESVLPFVCARGSRNAPGGTLFDAMSRIPPHSWLLEGKPWSSVVNRCAVEPAAFPRLVASIRIIGLTAVGIGTMIIGLILASTFVALP